MSDPRETPANTRVAAASLSNAPPGARRVTPTVQRVIEPVVNLLRTPNGKRDRQLLWGELVDLYELHEGWSYVQAQKDGFVGYLPSNALGPNQTSTHWVSAPASQIYESASIKSPDVYTLSFGSRLTALAETGEFLETADGFVPKVHTTPTGQHFDDPVVVAEKFLGTPYLWGGNSRAGIDCSGLVQASLLACGYRCPGDSDQQQAALGFDVDDGQPARRGDLIFWKGHVALVVEPDRIIHANGNDMAVCYAPLQAAIRRIQDQGDGPVTAHKRL